MSPFDDFLYIESSSITLALRHQCAAEREACLVTVDALLVASSQPSARRSRAPSRKMGCCVSKSGVDGQYAASNASRREEAWRRTGVVGLRDAGLKEIPGVVFSDDALRVVVKTLDASNNRLAALPDAVGALSNLRSLVLARNAIARLPLSLGTCANLRALVLDDNRLETLPESDAFFAGLARLKSFSLARNKLAALPDGIGALRALESLDVSGNALATLPSAIGKCAALEAVDVSENAPASSTSTSAEFLLPAELGFCKRLRDLACDGAPVTTVPGEILVRCDRLVRLSLHDCPIDVSRLEETPGWASYEARVKGKHSKTIAGGAMVGARGLDDGVDRREERIAPHAGRG